MNTYNQTHIQTEKETIIHTYTYIQTHIQRDTYKKAHTYRDI